MRPLLALALMAAITARGEAAERRAFVDAESVPSVSLEPHVRSVRAVRPRLDDLERVRPGEVLSIDVAPGRSVEGVVERVDRRGPRRCSIAGRIDGRHQFILVLEGDALAGSISTGSELFDLRYLGDGVSRVRGLDAALLDACGGAPPAPRIDVAGMPLRRGSDGRVTFAREVNCILRGGGEDAEAAHGGGPCGGDVGEIVDVLVLYTSAARIAAGGTDAMRAVVRLAIETVNVSAEASGIGHMRWRLVYQGETTYDEVGASTARDMLEDLTHPGGGMDEVFALRDQYGADQVALICEILPDAGGIAWCAPTSDLQFSITRRSAVANHTFAHELGHNQGCDHDVGNSSGACAATTAFGWRWTGADGLEYRSVMAYSPGIRVPRYSNPQVLYQGVPTGSSSARNAQQIDAVGAATIAHRQNRFDLWVDFGLPVNGDGSFAAPYVDLAAAVNAMPDVTGLGLDHVPALRITAGASGAPITIERPCTLSACGGAVTIGDDG